MWETGGDRGKRKELREKPHPAVGGWCSQRRSTHIRQNILSTFCRVERERDGGREEGNLLRADKSAVSGWSLFTSSGAVSTRTKRIIEPFLPGETPAKALGIISRFTFFYFYKLMFCSLRTCGSHSDLHWYLLDIFISQLVIVLFSRRQRWCPATDMHHPSRWVGTEGAEAFVLYLFVCFIKVQFPPRATGMSAVTLQTAAVTQQCF